MWKIMSQSCCEHSHPPLCSTLYLGLLHFIFFYYPESRHSIPSFLRIPQEGLCLAIQELQHDWLSKPWAIGPFLAIPSSDNSPILGFTTPTYPLTHCSHKPWTSSGVRNGLPGELLDHLALPVPSTKHVLYSPHLENRSVLHLSLSFVHASVILCAALYYRCSHVCFFH